LWSTIQPSVFPGPLGSCWGRRNCKCEGGNQFLETHLVKWILEEQKNQLMNKT
jgi:hypothetical protein